MVDPPGRCPAPIASLLALSTLLGGCFPPDTGECSEAMARTVVFTDDARGLPAYAGQALINRSCGAGAFCHGEDASDRYGAPFGMDFDLSVAIDAEGTERLRQSQANVHRLQRFVLGQVRGETMPPGAIGAEIEAAGPPYRDLPELRTPEGIEILRNWLACGSPVVERTTRRPPGIEPVGAVIGARPGTPPGGCTGGLVDCGGTCVNPSTDPANCGGCGTPCDGAAFCAAGMCTTECPAGSTECARACVDVSSDAANCGGCNVVCGAGSTCDGGSCACGAGLTDCGGACVDITVSAAHCGGCGNACGAGSSCEASACVACGDSVRFGRDIAPMLGTCTGAMCHSGRRPAADLDLGAGAHAALVGVDSSCSDGRLLVETGAPDRSYLIDKLRGRNLCRGQLMPLRAPALPEADIARFEDWVCGGARND